MGKSTPLDLTKVIPWRILAERVNWLIKNMPTLEPVSIVTTRADAFERTLELQEHHGAACWTDDEMDKKRQDRCLCYDCKLISSCQIAAQLFDLCCRGDIATMVTRCKHFQSKEIDDEGQSSSGS